MKFNFVFVVVNSAHPFFCSANQDLVCEERRINELNLSRTPDRLKAMLLFVPDATQPPERAGWAACLTGSILLDNSCLSGTGVVVAYKKLDKSKGKIFLTDQFKEKHPMIAKLLVDCNNFKTAKNQTVAKYILKTSQEVADDEDDPKSFTKPGFLEHIKKIDMKRSGMMHRS